MRKSSRVIAVCLVIPVAMIVVGVTYYASRISKDRQQHELRKKAGRLGVLGLHISQDEGSLIAVGESGLVATWDIRTGRLRSHFVVEHTPVHGFAISNDGLTIATANFDGIVDFSLLESGKAVEHIQFDDASVIQGVHYDKENDFLLVADIADTLHVCKVSDGKRSIKKINTPGRFLSYSKKHNLILACSGWGELRGLRLVGGDVVEVFRELFPHVCQMHCDSDSDFLGMCTRDGSVLIFDLETRRKLFDQQTQAAPAICVRMAHPDIVFSGGYARGYLWDWQRNKQLARIVKTDEQITAACFSGDRRRIFVACPGFSVSAHDQAGDLVQSLSLELQ